MTTAAHRPVVTALLLAIAMAAWAPTVADRIGGPSSPSAGARPHTQVVVASAAPIVLM